MTVRRRVDGDLPGERAVIKTLRDGAVNVDIKDLPDWAMPEASASLAGTRWELTREDEDGKPVTHTYNFF